MPAVARVGDTISHDGIIVDGVIITSASRTKVEGKLAARQGDQVLCSKHDLQVIAGGTSHVLVEGKPVACIGDMISCGAIIMSGADSVKVG
jgi:uncharacterized Zn-binding protein involved in type VI secretion